MRILRWLSVFFLLLVVAAAAAVAWVQTPAGACVVSRWVTRQIQASAPKTRVDLETLKPRWPLSLAAGRAVWSDAGGRPILTLAPFRVALNRDGWEGEGQVTRLDLAALDHAAARGEWKSDGFLHGPVRFRGRGGEIQDIDLDLQSDQPGGNLNSEVLERLVEMMPPDDTRAVLLKALGAKAVFHFNIGKVGFTTQDGNYVLSLILDGDHLLDLTVRVPRDSLKLLKETHLWK